jgi:exo-beta-1,3-glucanase (GH17 family)
MSKIVLPLPQILISIIVSASMALAAWYGIAHPRDVDVAWEGPLKSASFAPFRDGQSPLKEVFPEREQIEADLVRLKGIFEGVRTYTALGGMEVVPELAAKHGFALTHSAWLGREAKRNDEEVDQLISTANQYPQAVKRVIVGNEVLLRQDLKPDELIAYIDRVRGAIKQPVSYADVWAFWLKNPQIAEHVDYITIHILPYWEDEPVSVDEAQHHMLAIIDRIKARFPGKPILVGETGWPTEGRSRGPAHANLLTAAHFVRDLPTLAKEHDFDYNVVEAYDQPWKAQLEGTVGARWGMLDEARDHKFLLTGPVVPIDNAVPRAVASVVLGLLVALLLVSRVKNIQNALLIGIWSQLFSAALVQAVYKSLRLTLSPTSFTWAEQHVLFFMADHHWLSDASVTFWYKLLLQTLAEPFAHVWGGLLAGFSMAFSAASLLWVRTLLAGTPTGRAATLSRSALGLYGIGAIIFALMFSTSGRYIDIPLPLFLLPLSVVALLWYLRRQDVTRQAEDYAVFTRCGFFNRHAIWLLSLAALACIWGEAGAMLGGSDFISMHPTLGERIPLIARSILANYELLLWCLACVLLALPFRPVKPLE